MSDDRDFLADLLMSDRVMRTDAMGRDYALVEADAILAAGFTRGMPPKGCERCEEET